MVKKMLVKNSLKNILHLLLYLIVIFVTILTIHIFHNSYIGFRKKDISNTSYIYYSGKEIITFFDEHVEVIKDYESSFYSYTINNGRVNFDDKEFIIFGNGLLNDERNTFYQKANKIYSLSEDM